MATVLKLGFSLVFGLLTFVLPLPIGGEQLFGEWGRAALFLSLLCGLVLSFAKLDGRILVEHVLTRSKGRKGALALVLVAGSSVAGYLAMRGEIKVPDGAMLWVEVLMFFVASLSLGVILTVAGALTARALLTKGT